MTEPISPATSQDGVPRLYGQLRCWIDAVDGVLVAIGSAMLFTMMVLVFADVFRRYAFNAPIAWSYEVINNYLMPGLFFFSVSHTLKANAHVAVDILHNYVSRKTRYVFEALAMTLSVPAFALCTWMAAGNTLAEFHAASEATTGLSVPSWTVSIAFPIGFGMLTLRVILNSVGYIAKLITGRPFKELPPIAGTEEGMK